MRLPGELATRARERCLTALLVIAAGLPLSACGDTVPTAIPGAPTANLVPPTSAPYTKSNQVIITLKDFQIVPSNMGIPAGKVAFTVNNEGQFAHDLVISNDTGVITKTVVFKKSDGPQTLNLTLKAGTYKMQCDVPGHADKGMVGTLTVNP